MTDRAVTRYACILVHEKSRVEHVCADRVNINGGTTGMVAWNMPDGARCAWHGSPKSTILQFARSNGRP